MSFFISTYSCLTDFCFNSVLLLLFHLTILKFIIFIFFLQLLPLTTSFFPCLGSSKSPPSSSVIYSNSFTSFLQSKSSQYSVRVSLSSFILLHFPFLAHSSLIHCHHSFACTQISVPLCLFNHLTYPRSSSLTPGIFHH